ncbi:MAG: GNAT family N-acetyltransferase [Chloracidobacterium sp.]|nr:GNAT family N-acetyltransferase [Chloracidobacterium sp.]
MIRKICPEDLPTVLELLRELAAYEDLISYCTVTEERLHTAMFGADPVVKGLIAFDDEAAIGYALYYPNFSSFRGERGFHLDDIYVKKEYRGKGIGEAVLKEIARDAASKGFERIDFQVLDWNTPSIEFYKKLGAVSNDEETHFKFAGDAFEKLAG